MHAPTECFDRTFFENMSVSPGATSCSCGRPVGFLFHPRPTPLPARCLEHARSTGNDCCQVSMTQGGGYITRRVIYITPRGLWWHRRNRLADAAEIKRDRTGEMTSSNNACARSLPFLFWRKAASHKPAGRKEEKLAAFVNSLGVLFSSLNASLLRNVARTEKAPKTRDFPS